MKWICAWTWDPFLERPGNFGPESCLCLPRLFQDQSFNNFENDTMKLSANEAKLICAVGTFLLFNRFLFQNLRSGPKGYRSFRETGPWSVILGGLSNDDDDGKENGKQPIGLDWQNNNFASASRFFVHFNFTFCRGREHKTTTCFFFFWTLLQLFRIQLQKKKLPTFDELNELE